MIDYTKTGSKSSRKYREKILYPLHRYMAFKIQTRKRIHQIKKYARRFKDFTSTNFCQVDLRVDRKMKLITRERKQSLLSNRIHHQINKATPLSWLT